MLAVNAPKKLVARVQTLVCLVLAFLCLIFSFTAPLVSIDFKDAKVINEALDSLQEAGIDRSKIGEIPEKISVSAVNMYGVVGTFANLVKAAGAKDGEKAMSAVFDENGNLKEGAKTSVLIAAALATNIVGEAEDSSNSSSSNGFGAIIAMLIPIFATFALLVFSMIAPFYYIIAFLIILIAVLKNWANPEEATAKVCGRLPKTIIVPIFIMLYACVTKTLSPGSGAIMLFVFVLLSSILNLVATRMHAWDQKTIKFANIVQGLSLVSVLGYIIYLFNIIKTGVFRTFITNNAFLEAAGKAAVNQAASAYTGTNTKVFEDKQSFVLDLILILVAIEIVLFSYRYLSAVLRRATLSLKKGDKPGHIIFAVILMFSAILPFVVKGMKHPTDSYLEGMTAEQNAALTGALIGLIIILLSEIALIVLQKVLCEDISESEMSDILTNTATTAEERIAKAKAVLDAEGVAVEASAKVEEEKTEE